MWSFLQSNDLKKKKKNRVQDMSKKRNPVNIPGSQSGYLEGYTPGLWGWADETEVD